LINSFLSALADVVSALLFTRALLGDDESGLPEATNDQAKLNLALKAMNIKVE